MPVENGVVYTKRWVVDMILDLVGYIPGTNITDKVIVEPSCGSGAFMIAITERLTNEFLSRDLSWSYITKAVRAFDVDSVAVEITKKRIQRILCSKGCPNLIASKIVNTWVKCSDFILDNAPDCDFVVGNPPYVRAKEIDRQKRDLYCEKLPSVTSGCDLFVSFFDRGLDILREGGSLCFICADRWLQNAYGKKLRKRIGSSCNMNLLMRMHDVDAFNNQVSAYPAITLIKKKPPQGMLKFVNCSPAFEPMDVPKVMNWLHNSSGKLCSEHFEAFEISHPNGDSVYPLGSPELVNFVNEACNKLPTIEQAGVKIGIGIATGCDAVFLTEKEDLVEADRMLPLFYMRDHRKGNTDRKRWLVNPWKEDGTLVDLDEYPKLKTYFEENRSILSKRYVAQSNQASWYRTIDKLLPDLLKRDLLLMPDMSNQPDPILSRGYYPHHNCYWLTSDIWEPCELGGLLMADTTRRFIDAFGVKMRGGTLRFQAQYLRYVHIPQYDQVSKRTLEGLRQAFNEKNREMATKFAEIAYKESML